MFDSLQVPHKRVGSKTPRKSSANSESHVFASNCAGISKKNSNYAGVSVILDECNTEMTHV